MSDPGHLEDASAAVVAGSSPANRRMIFMYNIIVKPGTSQRALHSKQSMLDDLLAQPFADWPVLEFFLREMYSSK